VLRLDAIRDPEILRQIAKLLERENDKLHTKLQDLTRELSRLRGDDASAAQRQFEALKELLAQRERALFDASSEKRPRPEPTTSAPAPTPSRGHGPKAQPQLPHVEMVHVLHEADRTCPACGGTLREMTGQTEDSEEVTVVERQFVILQHRRQKYRCACNGWVETAPGPLRLAARPDARGRRYSADFAVEVAIGKYLDHRVPRMRPKMSRKGEQCCGRDEGRPLGVGVQDQAPNHLTLPWSRARVVNGEGNGAPERVRWGSGRRTRVNRR
jgi:transposase